MKNRLNAYLQLGIKKDSVNYRKSITANFILLFSLVILIVFTISNFLYANLPLFYSSAFIFVLYCISLLIFKGKKKLLVHIVLSIMGGGILLLVYINKGQQYIAVWSFIYIYASMILYGHKKGLILAIAYSSILLIMLANWIGESFATLAFIRFSAVILVSVFFSYISEFLIFSTVNKLSKTKKHLEKINKMDGLTNVYNRRQFDAVFRKVINTAKRNRNLLAFVMLDIDYFKDYNDAYGHQDGDLALVKVAQQLKDKMNRSNDAVFRLGGEEFALLYQVKKELDAVALLEEIKNAVEQLQIEHSGSDISNYLTISAGLYIIKQEDNISDQGAYKACDDLLYKAKSRGRNQIVHSVINSN